MPDAAVLKRIACLEGLHVFRKYSAPADLPALRKHNLVYGFNGSGKSTLAKLLASFGKGAPDPTLPDGCVFQVELSDATVLRNGAAIESLKDRVFVFNDAFVKENFDWKGGTAHPVFFIGKEQKDLAQQLDSEAEAKRNIDGKLGEANTLLGQATSAFTQRKRETARLIAEQLNLGRKYTATHLDDDYSNKSYIDLAKLSEEERQALRTTITQDAPPAKIKKIDPPAITVASIVAESLQLLEKTLGAIALEELQSHERMFQWLRQGLEYHNANELEQCLFCGNHLAPERLASLAAALDDRFTALVVAIENARGVNERSIRRVAEFREAIPAKGEIAVEYRASYEDARMRLLESIAGATRLLSEVDAALDAKAQNPASVPSQHPSVEGAEQIDEALRATIGTLNAIIAKHNGFHDAFDAAQEEARRKLKDHYLAESQSLYRDSETLVADSEHIRNALARKQQQHARHIEDFKRQVRTHGPAAERINRMIHTYLGHKELEIAVVDNDDEPGYQLRREGTRATGPPSEGEKTAIVLCYFLVLLVS